MRSFALPLLLFKWIEEGIKTCLTNIQVCLPLVKRLRDFRQQAV